ncbi:MAG: hypothetical protein DRP03_02400 [Candidatus Aenigmatarchaeota archaeon]|nr:MAG: hypothetical protein DRP03_02400 [Candidatus Aenigmarchaeota archaeon]
MVVVFNKTRNERVENIEVACSLFKRAKGLMFRKNGRMLFDFKKETKAGIWMLFVKFPLDIVFIGDDQKINKIVRDAKPISLNPKTWRLYRARCRFVLEVMAGETRTWQEEDKIKIVWDHERSDKSNC